MFRFTTFRLAAAVPLAVAALVLLPLPAAHANGGDREPAGGAFMSSYVTNPYATSPYATSRSPAEARPLDRPAPFFAPETTGSVRALPARPRVRR